MTSSRSCSNKPKSLLLAAFLFFIGCAHAVSPDGAVLPGAKGFRIAVLPVENLSRTRAPLEEIRQSLIASLRNRGFSILDEDSLLVFMARHRMRHVGGINEVLSAELKAGTGADAVLLTTLELYDETNPPRIAVTSRLVSSGMSPAILWMDSAAMAGDDSPGFLGLGRIENPRVIRERALDLLMASFRAAPAEVGPLAGARPPLRLRSTFRPKISYRSITLDPGKTYTAAVLPFGNLSGRKTADDLLALHFVRQLAERMNFRVVEPGVVRQRLLNMRIIMPEGPSGNDADLLFNSLGADLIFTGKVMVYSDYEGSGDAKADFSVMVMERATRRVGWAFLSYNSGRDSVVFFDLGKVTTAHALASEMAGLVVSAMLK
jgi:hypothetical protein